jgi:hypothetical protein
MRGRSTIAALVEKFASVLFELILDIRQLVIIALSRIS